MRDEYTVLLEKSLSDANEMIGALRACLEMVLDGERPEIAAKIARTMIKESRGISNEVDN